METLNNALVTLTATEQLDTAINLSDQEARISELAYYKAEARDFESGYELNDWLEAEQEYNAV